jgi:hypothetical protein
MTNMHILCVPYITITCSYMMIFGKQIREWNERLGIEFYDDLLTNVLKFILGKLVHSARHLVLLYPIHARYILLCTYDQTH